MNKVFIICCLLAGCILAACTPHNEPEEKPDTLDTIINTVSYDTLPYMEARSVCVTLMQNIGTEKMIAIFDIYPQLPHAWEVADKAIHCPYGLHPKTETLYGNAPACGTYQMDGDFRQPDTYYIYPYSTYNHIRVTYADLGIIADEPTETWPYTVDDLFKPITDCSFTLNQQTDSTYSIEGSAVIDDRLYQAFSFEGKLFYPDSVRH